jgi:hypothetical protein
MGGSAGQAGASGSAGSGGAPECMGDPGYCLATGQPKVCAEGMWVNDGGPCNYGCDAGHCDCSAPNRFYDPAGIKGVTSRDVADIELKKSWHVYQGFGDFNAAKLLCPGTTRLPTFSEVRGKLIAQQSTVTQCGPTKNLATAFLEAIQANADPATINTPIWTSDTDNTGMVLTVHVPSGIVSTRDPLQPSYVLVFCLDK